MTETQPSSSSPRWGAITKLVVTLTVVVVAGALLIRFHTIIIPVLMAFIVAYLFHPLSGLMQKKLHFSWAAAVNVIYLVVLVVLIALLLWGGVGLVTQIQNLIVTVQNNIDRLPAFIDSLSHRIFTLGPFTLDLSRFDWQAIGQQVLSYVEPALGKLGGLVGTLAESAVTTLGWLAFVVIVSYFFLLESGGLRDRIIRIDVPGYAEDMDRLKERLGRIWNAFLRGQIIIFISKVIAYTVVLTLLGVHYSIGLALLAGFASFLPYIGPAINWIVLGLVTYFQGSTIFGLSPFGYVVMVIIVALVIDQIFDNLVAPRVMAQNLRVHPAFVLIAAIIAANLIGLLGVIVAAPLLATVQLIGRYTIRKLLDRDPWPPEDDVPQPARRSKMWKRFLRWLRSLRKKTT